MKKILFMLKIFIVLFLILFFFAGLNVTLSSEKNNSIFISIIMLIVNAALVIGLSRKWFFPKKIIQVWDANSENTTDNHSKKERQSSIQVNSTTQYTPDTTKIIVEPKKPIIEHETKIETQPKQPSIAQETKIETQPKQTSIAQETKIETQPKQPSIAQEIKIETQPEQSFIKTEINPQEPKQPSNNSDEMKIMAEFPAIQTTFTYLSNSGKALRTVDISQYKKDKHGEEYIAGYCHITNKHSDFAIKKIQSMMTTSRYPKYSVHDWLINVAGIDVNG